jgi:SAM-dependent methyltransferase
MLTPLYNRRDIPFFYDKSDHEFRQDDYERYHEMVVRQSALHLADLFWERYPFQPVFDFGEKYYPKEQEINILEVGCGVGRWIAGLAQRYPISNCWGIDYSYQMLKRANEFWLAGQEISIDLKDRGLDQILLKSETLHNLKFGLAKAEKLPHENNSQQLVVSSFLLDRVDNPMQCLKEMYRVLVPSGQLILISPLNFKIADHWTRYYPPSKLSDILSDIGFDILDWQEDMIVHEPLDAHGNSITWQCLAFVVRK